MATKLAQHRLVAGIAIMLWATSLFFPSLQAGAGPGSASYRGFNILVTGWAGPIGGAFAWYANIPWVLEVIRQVKGEAPRLWLSAFALLLASSMILTPPLPVSGESSSGPVTFAVGAWIWLLSFCVVFGAALLSVLKASGTAGRPSRSMSTSDEARSPLARQQLQETGAPHVGGRQCAPRPDRW